MSETTTDAIEWLTSLDEALAHARFLRRPVLLELYDKTCGSCIKLEATTLRDPEVADAIRDVVVPVRVLVRNAEDGEVARQYLDAWTPTALLLSPDGDVYDQWTGYRPPDAFVLHLRMALAKAALREMHYADAADLFDELTECAYDDLAAEAIYWTGMARFKADADLAALISTWSELHTRFPQTSWKQSALIEAPGEWPEAVCEL